MIKKIIGKREHMAWGILVLVAVVVAALLVGMNAPLSNDGVIYLNLSQEIRNGQFGNTIFPPGFPAVIAAVSALGFTPLVAGRLVMFVSIALLPILLAGSFRPYVGTKSAIAAGVCWLVFPLNIAISRGLWTEPLFYALVLVFIAIPDNAGKRTWLSPSMRGAIAAASYLVRPEGIIIFAIDTVRRLLADGWTGCRQFVRPAVYSFAVFLLCISPYILFLHHQTGRWMLSGKTSYNLAISDRMSSEDVWRERECKPEATLSEDIVQTGRRYVKNAKKASDSFLAMFALPGLILIGFGLSAFLRRVSYAGGGALFALAAPSVIVPFFFFAEDRLLFGACLVGAVLVGSGVVSCMGECRAANRSRPAVFLARTIALSLIFAYITSCVTQSRYLFNGHVGAGEIRRTLGQRVSDQAEGEKMMSISLVTPYYARAKSSGWPVQSSIDEVYQYAFSNNVRFIEVSSYDSEAFHPSVLALLDKQRTDHRFKDVCSATSSWGDVFSIFEIDMVPLLIRDEPASKGEAKEWEPSNKAIEKDED